MAFNQVASKTASRFAGRALGTYLKFSLYFVFLLFIILNAIIIGIEEKSLAPVLQDLGQRIVAPMYEIYESSTDIAENGVLPQDNTPFMNIIFMFKNYVLLFFNLAVIVGWIRFIYWIIHRFDSSQQVLWTFMSIFIFLTIQWLYIAYFTDGSLMDPLYAIGAFIKIIPILIDPFTQIAVEQAPDVSDLVINTTNGTI